LFAQSEAALARCMERAVLGGLDTTFRVLAESHNDAATTVLLRLVDAAQAGGAPAADLRMRALRTLLHRPEIGSRLAVLERWPQLGAAERQLLREERGRLTQAISETLAAGDPRHSASACEAIIELDEYEQFPLLAQLAIESESSRAELMATTLRTLADRLYTHATGPRDYSDRRDLARIRAHIGETLEGAVLTFAKHRQTAVLEAFLSLVHRGSGLLRRVLRDPRDANYSAITELMEFSPLAGVMDLTLSFLDDPSPPPVALRIISSRTDRPFMTTFTAKLHANVSHLARENLRRIDHVAWLNGDFSLVDGLDEASQAGAVQLAAISGMHPDEILELLDHVLTSGNLGGRRAASRAVASYDSPLATKLLRRALEDPDPQVQANVLAHLRPRNVSGALSTLIAMVDSPHEAVRVAARDGLSEFNFERFLHAFDSLDEDARRTTGELVKKIDAMAMPQLAEELRAMSRTRRIRALAVVEAMDAGLEMEPAMIELLADDDHVVRAAAVNAMSGCPTAGARDALREALFDRSIIVQEAAENGLAKLAELVRRKQRDFEFRPRRDEVVERTYVINGRRLLAESVGDEISGGAAATDDALNAGGEVTPC
jgi:HEAT repeat protein